MNDPRLMIPILRTALPNLMAQQITGVQPMSGMFKVLDKTYLNVDQNSRYWPYKMVIEDWYQISTAERFCYDNFKSRNWRNINRHFYFKRHEDAALFTLRWS